MLGSWVVSMAPGVVSVQRWGSPRPGRCEWLLPLRSAGASSSTFQAYFSKQFCRSLYLYVSIGLGCPSIVPLLRSFFLPDYRSLGDGSDACHVPLFVVFSSGGCSLLPWSAYRYALHHFESRGDDLAPRNILNKCQ